jgi:hypothetical protein
VAVGAKLGLPPSAVESGKVTTRRESLAGSGQDYSSHLPLVRRVREHSKQLALQRPVEGVPLLGTVQLHEERAVI